MPKILKSQRYLLLLGLFFSAMLLNSMLQFGYARASTSDTETITLSPASQDLKVKAGEVVKGSFKVVNSGKVPFEYSVYPRPYFVRNESYDPVFEKVGTNTDLFEWVALESASYAINPGETKDIPYSIRVPSNASPGGHYGVIFAESQPMKNAGQSVARKKRVGMVVRMTVEGNSTVKGSVVSSEAEFWQTTPPLTANIRVKNSGNTDFQSTNTVIVKDLFGNVKQKTVRQAVIYPGTIRRIEFAWDTAPWFGLFKVETQSEFSATSDKDLHYVLLLPRWLALIVLLFASGGAAYGLLRRR